MQNKILDTSYLILNEIAEKEIQYYDEVFFQILRLQDIHELTERQSASVLKFFDIDFNSMSASLYHSSIVKEEFLEFLTKLSQSYYDKTRLIKLILTAFKNAILTRQELNETFVKLDLNKTFFTLYQEYNTTQSLIN